MNLKIKKMTTSIKYCIAEPVDDSGSVPLLDRSRYPRAGKQLALAQTIEMQKIRDELRMTAQEMARAMLQMDKKRLSEKSIRAKAQNIQSYIQGNVDGEESVDKMLAQMRRLSQFVLSNRGTSISSKSARQIIDGWCKALKIDIDGKESPFRALGAAIGKDFTTLWRWHKDDRLPKSMQTIIDLDAKVKELVAQAKKKRVG